MHGWQFVKAQLELQMYLVVYDADEVCITDSVREPYDLFFADLYREFVRVEEDVRIVCAVASEVMSGFDHVPLARDVHHDGGA